MNLKQFAKKVNEALEKYGENAAVDFDEIMFVDPWPGCSRSGYVLGRITEEDDGEE